MILPTASAPDGKGVPEHWGRMGVAHFRGLGAQAAEVLALTREDCDRSEHADAVRRANLIYFSGGKPDYLYRTLHGTALWQAVLDVLAAGGVLAGCSAGAMIFGSYMPDVNAFPPLVRWGPAFGLVPGTVVIPHFDEIPGALVSLAARLRPKGSTLIGVEGNTALVGSGGFAGARTLSAQLVLVGSLVRASFQASERWVRQSLRARQRSPAALFPSTRFGAGRR